MPVVFPRKKANRDGSNLAKWNDAVPSRETQHELKREALFREAAKGFNHRGFHGTSLAELAETLGITKAALYHYVPNKHELLYRCLYHSTEAAFSAVDYGRKNGANGLEKLRLAVKEYFILVLGDNASPSVTLYDAGALDEKSAETIYARRKQTSKDLREFVSEGIEDGSIIPCDPKLVINVILGTMNWTPRWYVSDGEWNEEHVSGEVADMLMRSIAANP